jgi:hypothetical protein
MIEAMKQALEALEYADEMIDTACVPKAITNLRIAIEQAEKIEPVIGTKTWYEDGKVITQNLYPSDVYKQEKQEPVAIYQYQLASGSWIDQTKNSYDYNVRHGQATVRVVYTTPQPQREWVGLTLDEKKEYLAQDFGGSRADAVDWAEQRLKEKNCG